MWSTHCWFEEDTYHMVTRCPSFHDIRVSSVDQLKQKVVEQSGGSVWSSYFYTCILKVLICPDCVTPLVPGLLVSFYNIEKVSRTFFYKVHLKRLKLLRQREKWLCVSDYFFYILQIIPKLYQQQFN